MRRLNWARRGWSGATDRVYHDAAFRGATYDATDPSYPGWITIRRFADLASSSLDGAVRRRQRRHLGGPTVAPTLAGPYDAVYRVDSVPSEVTSGAEVAVVVSVTNRSWREWSSHDPARIFLSSRILNQRGDMVIADGPRTPFPRTVQPVEACSVYLKVRAPNEP